jgi:glyoxylase-like metal-dependent hydrolase (beta-lactamase superfamily II)
LSDWFKVLEIDTGVWAIQEPYHIEEVVSYLVEGRETSALVDTGLGVADILPVVKELTSLPLRVINTHSHYDHVGDNHQFKDIAIHHSEARRLEREVDVGKLAEMMRPEMFFRTPPAGFDPQEYHIKPSTATQILKDGDVLSLGDRDLVVIHTPGHSPGSICLWEKERGLLFTGDAIYDGPIYAQLPHSDFDVYLDSLNRLCALTPQIRWVLPAHGSTPLEPQFVFKITKVFQQIADSGVGYRYTDSPWGRAREYTHDGLTVYVK